MMIGTNLETRNFEVMKINFWGILPCFWSENLTQKLLSKMIEFFTFVP